MALGDFAGAARFSGGHPRRLRRPPAISTRKIIFVIHIVNNLDRAYAAGKRGTDNVPIAHRENNDMKNHGGIFCVSEKVEAAQPPGIPAQDRGWCTRLRAIPTIGRAADTVNIGALYPTTGSMAQIGVGCVAAGQARGRKMINEAGGIKSLGGAKLNLIVSDVQSDTTVTRTENRPAITGNKPPQSTAATPAPSP